MTTPSTQKVGISLAGKEVEGERIGFEIVKDSWQHLRLDNGTEVRVKLVVFDVLKTEDRNAEGQRIYVVRSQAIVVSNEPPIQATKAKPRPPKAKRRRS